MFYVFALLVVFAIPIHFHITNDLNDFFFFFVHFNNVAAKWIILTFNSISVHITVKIRTWVKNGIYWWILAFKALYWLLSKFQKFTDGFRLNIRIIYLIVSKTSNHFNNLNFYKRDLVNHLESSTINDSKSHYLIHFLQIVRYFFGCLQSYIIRLNYYDILIKRFFLFSF